MKNITLLIVFSILSLSSFSQTDSKSVNKSNKDNSSSQIKLLDNFILSAEINIIEAMHLNGIADSNDDDIENLSSFVIKLKKDFSLNKKLNLFTSVGYSFGFEYLPLELGFSYEIIDNLSAKIGCGLFSITDDRWVTSGLDGEEPSDNDFGLAFGVDYMLNDRIGIQINYNSIESSEEIDLGSMSLNSLSFGLRYNL
jgi:hypothetical protein